MPAALHPERAASTVAAAQRQPTHGGRSWCLGACFALAFTGLSLYIHIVSTLDLAKLIVQLAAEFKRRDMRGHVELLRPYYRGFVERKRASMREKKPPWTEELVIEWLCILQVPPFENVLPTLAVGARACGCSVKDVGLAMISCVFPGGRVRECKGCGARWLERTSS